MPQNKETREVQNPCLLEIGKRDDVLIWRQHSGLLYTRDGTPQRIGQPGMSDAGGIVRVTITPDMVGKTVGIAIQPEFKAETGRQTIEQRRWEQAITGVGGVYALIRSVDDMVRMVESVKNGEWG